MSRWSRDQRDRREREYDAWYATLTDEQKRAEDRLQEAKVFKGVIYITLGAVAIFAAIVFQHWLNGVLGR